MTSLEHTEIPLCEVCEHTYTRTLAISPARPYEFNSLSTTSPSASDITNIQSRLTRCGEILEHLQRVAHLVEQEQSTLEKFVFNYTAETAIIRRLVPETLVEIFKCLEDNLSGTRSPKKGSFPPIIMSQVCSAWRKLAHSSPQLWTQVYIDTSRPQYEKMLEVYLYRSKACPLDITIEDVKFQRVIHLSLTLLEPHLQRIRVLRCPALSVASRTDNVEAPSSANSDVKTFGILETLELSRMPILHGWDITHLSFPNLRSFSMSGAIPPGLIGILPWSQITHVKMERSIELLALLETHHSLYSLEMFIPLLQAIPSRRKVSPMFFPSLRHLQIELEEDLSKEFDTITLPNLETLTLRYPKTGNPYPLTPRKDIFLQIKALVSRSGCATTLREFHFDWVDSINSKSLIPLLKTTPNIRHLTLLISGPYSAIAGTSRDRYTELFFKRLSESPIVFLPNLQTLTLSQYGALPTCLPTILRLRCLTLLSLLLGDWTQGRRDDASLSIYISDMIQAGTDAQFMAFYQGSVMKEKEREETRTVMAELKAMRSDDMRVVRCQHTSSEFKEVCGVCI
ncbi:hypothetical protein DL96DRAFT_1540768 [Flagelloscypha sp. PMI_526]|nr:hypothetical protein DL96DRAFT_1540768 [Flagelloscypha sp. PMI_526]